MDSKGSWSCLRIKIILLLLYGVVQTEGALGVEGARQGEVSVSVAGLSPGEGGGGCVDNFPRQTQASVRPGVLPVMTVILH